jgi:arabinofuranosyltransferase
VAVTTGLGRVVSSPLGRFVERSVGSAVGSRLSWVVVAAAVVAFLLLCLRLSGFVTDDSWISVRYAENLARGEGPVWNPGGERVEGYSNPALVAVEALADLAGWSALAAARTLGVLSGAACVLLVHARGRHVVGEAAAVAGAVLTALSAPFALWAVGGLETLPVALLLTLAVLELARPDGGRPALAAGLLAVLPWLRPEGLVVALAVVGASEVAGLLRRGTRRATLRRLAWLLGVPVLSQAALEAVRLGVYGHLVPNSVLYKSGTGELFFVAGKFLAQAQLVVALALVGVVVARRRQRLLAAPFAVYLLGSIGTLDSANAYSRFFLPVWPQLALLGGVAVAAFVAAARLPVWSAAALAAAAGATALVVLPAGLDEVDGWQSRYMTCRAGARADVARWLVAETPPGTTFSVSDAGLLPARAGGRTAVDAFLLNEPLIQETGPMPPREHAEFVHSRRPDVVVLASRDASRLDPVYPTDAAVARHPAMAAYHLAHVGSGDWSCGYHLMAFRR